MTSLSFSKRIDAVITYLDISEKSKLNKRRENNYIGQIKDCIAAFIEKYKKSLNCPCDHWKDIEGREHPYVYIAVSGEITQPRHLDVHLRDGAAFTLVTVVDDDPLDAKHCSLECRFYTVDKKFKIKIRGENDRTFSFDDGGSQACDFIKEYIMMQINKHSLGMASDGEIY